MTEALDSLAAHCERAHDTLRARIQLLRIGFDSDPTARAALAIVDDDCKALAKLLSTGAKANAAYCGNCLLGIAALENRPKCVAILLTASADPDTYDDSDFATDRPLRLAASKGNLRCLQLLLSARASVGTLNSNDEDNAHHNRECTPLQAASEYPRE